MDSSTKVCRTSVPRCSTQNFPASMTTQGRCYEKQIPASKNIKIVRFLIISQAGR